MDHILIVPFGRLNLLFGYIHIESYLLLKSGFLNPNRLTGDDLDKIINNWSHLNTAKYVLIIIPFKHWQLTNKHSIYKINKLLSVNEVLLSNDR